ncbi:MAG: substrate-binding domain-containing protein [Thiothrix sp.]|nr:substrate-binding domain-containing protein [Thiothrix sp.]HPQ95670.1 substrate-binding domain-containing protein [Thiolinea sp.]
MSLKELSRKLGLSQTTVSRALNGYPEVGAKTRERVLKVAAEMNYRPNRFAKSLATGKSGHIGIIFPVERKLLATPLFNEFLAGISQFLVEKDMDLTIMPVKAEQELQAYRALARSGRVDGLILSTPQLNDPRIACLSDLDVPYIMHGRLHPEDTVNDPDHITFPYLDIDNQGAFERATRLLIDMGHENIALVNDDPYFTFAHHRLAGYRAALESSGLKFRPENVYADEMTEERGFHAASTALHKSRPPTAFLASSIILALGIKRAIRETGLRPGRDISIITHDDELPYLQANKFTPPLTAVTSSICRAGYLVASKLHALIESPELCQPASIRKNFQQVLEVDLIVRNSTSAR